MNGQFGSAERWSCVVTFGHRAKVSGRYVVGLVIYRYDAPLCFADAEDFRRQAAPSKPMSKSI